ALMFKQLRGQAVRLAAEHETIALAKRDFREGQCRFRAETKNAFQRTSHFEPRFLEFGPRSMSMHLDGVPVVKARAAQRARIEAKAKAADKVQGRASGCAEPRDVSRVGRYFRFPKRDVDHGTRFPSPHARLRACGCLA